MDTQTEIMGLADQKVVEFLRIDVQGKEFNQDRFDNLERQANVGHKVKREVNVHQRTQQDQFLRVVRLIGTTPEMREQYIRASQPKMLPQLKARP